MSNNPIKRFVTLMQQIGEPREFANKLLDDWLQHRSRKMNRPHMRKRCSSAFLREIIIPDQVVLIDVVSTCNLLRPS